MARRAQQLEGAAVSLNATRSDSAVAVVGDVGRAQDCEAAAKQGASRFGHLDGLVNAAGTWFDAPFSECHYRRDGGDAAWTDKVKELNQTPRRCNSVRAPSEPMSRCAREQSILPPRRKI